MKTLLVALITPVALMAAADDLGALKTAAGRYVAAIKTVLALPKTTDCWDTSTKGSQYATAKMEYYQAARRAMPALLQLGQWRENGQRIRTRSNRTLSWLW